MHNARKRKQQDFKIIRSPSQHVAIVTKTVVAEVQTVAETIALCK